MARVNIHLPDDLAERARAARLNVSAVTQSALEAELAARAASAWLDAVARLPGAAATHDDVLRAVDAARAELAGRDVD